MSQFNYTTSRSNIEQDIEEITRVFSGQPRKPEFVHLLSKSLPRSGHHHLVSIMKRLYGEAFEYCEFYQPSEELCCKRQPCTKFCNTARASDGKRHVSMQKSHDFELADKKYVDSAWLKYVVMTRDFKDAVASEFKLFLIDRFSDFLASHQVDSREILQHHDKTLYRKALALIDDADLQVPPIEIVPFLNERFDYYNGFRNKWVSFVQENPDQAILIEYGELVGSGRLRIVKALIDLLGIPPAVPVEIALAEEPVMTSTERAQEESRAASRLIDANEKLLNYYDLALKSRTGYSRSWGWV